MLPPHIHATIDSQKLLQKVTRLFNASLSDILLEVLQNSRRAHATQVQVSLTESGTLRIEDDGCGIDHPQSLLSLGHSDWNTETLDQEDPAGMGVFSLANRGVTIASKNWQVHLSPSHFSGTEIAPVEPSLDRAGTTLEFPLLPNETPHLLRHLEAAAHYYPLPVWFNGTELPREDFLAHAVEARSWHGLRIGISSQSRWHDRAVGRINFHGVTVPHALPTLTCNDTQLQVRVEVENCPDLKLVLPARKEVVHSEFVDRLYVECQRLLYQYVATLEHHDLSYQHWVKAQRLGIDLPPAQPSLTPFSPVTAKGERSVDWQSSTLIDATALLVKVDEVEAPEQQLLSRALEQNPLPYTLYATKPEFEGYPWYDSLPQLTNLRFELELNEQVMSLDDALIQTHLASAVVARITAMTTLLIGQDRTRVPLPLDICFGYPSDDWSDISLDDVTLFHTQPSDLSASELADLLEAAFFSPHEDSDADCYDTQLDSFQEEALERAIRTLLSDEAALKARIEMTLDRHLRWVMPSTLQVEVIISPITSDAPTHWSGFRRVVTILP